MNRTPAPLRRGALLALALLAGCTPNTDGALRFVVDLDPTLTATCAELVVSAQSEPLQTLDFALGGDPQRVVGAKQGSLPGDVVVRVDAFSGDCAVAASRKLVARSADVPARFPRSGVEEVRLTVGKPDATLDADGDGFVAAAKGGVDCLDSDPAVHPGGAQVCASAIDGDCDGKLFCDDPACAGEAACTAGATGLAVTPSTADVLQGDCANALTLEARRSGVAAPVDRQRFVALTASGVPVAFFSDAQCSVPATVATLDFGASSVALHFVANGAGAATLTASDPDAVHPLGSATATVTVTSHVLALDGVPAQLAAGACSGAVTVRLLDAKSQPWSHTSAETVTVAVQGAASSGVSLFASPSCTGSGQGTLVTSVPAGSSTVTLSFSGTKVGAATLSASDIGRPAQASTTFGPGTAAKLALVDASSTVVAGACESPVQVEVRDAFDNPAPASRALTVTLSSSGTTTPAKFYSDSCNSLASSVVVPEKTATATFGFSPVSAGALTIVGTAGALTGSKVYSVSAGQPSSLAFKPPPPATLARYTCTATPAVVELRDGSGNAVPAPATTTLTLQGGAGVRFFAPGTACAGSPVASVSLPSGQSTVSFDLAAFGVAASPFTVTVASPSWGNATAQVALTDGSGAWAITAPSSEAAGGCAAVTVVRKNAAGTSMTLQPVDVTVSSGGAGLSTHTDSACTSTSPAVVHLNAGVSTGAVWVRGRSDNSVSTTLTASDANADYSAGTANTLALPLVRRGTCTVAIAETTHSCAISGLVAADAPRSLLVFQAAPNSWTPTDAELECHLDATPQVVCTRAGTNSVVAVTASWQVVTFGRDAANGGVSVQTITAPPSGSPTPFAWTISSVDTAKSFVLGSMAGAGNNIGDDDSPTFALSSATTVTLTGTATIGFSTAKVGFQVVQMAGASVQRGALTSQSGAGFNATLGSAVTTGRTFPLYSVRLVAAADNDNLCERRLRATVSDSTHLAFHRGGDAAAAACAAGTVEELDWEAVQLPTGASVQQVDLSMATGALSATATISAIAAHKTIALFPGQTWGGQAAGESDYVAVGSSVTAGQGDNLGEIHAVLSFPSATQVKADRSWGGPTSSTEAANAHFTAQVIQFAP